MEARVYHDNCVGLIEERWVDGAAVMAALLEQKERLLWYRSDPVMRTQLLNTVHCMMHVQMHQRTSEEETSALSGWLIRFHQGKDL